MTYVDDAAMIIRQQPSLWACRGFSGAERRTEAGLPRAADRGHPVAALDYPTVPQLSPVHCSPPPEGLDCPVLPVVSWRLRGGADVS